MRESSRVRVFHGRGRGFTGACIRVYFFKVEYSFCPELLNFPPALDGAARTSGWQHAKTLWDDATTLSTGCVFVAADINPR